MLCILIVYCISSKKTSKLQSSWKASIICLDVDISMLFYEKIMLSSSLDSLTDVHEQY